MTKLQFLLALQAKLTGLPQAEVEERLRFYSEIIEDRVEDGLPEEEAVAQIGPVDEIVTQILAEFPPVAIPETEKTQETGKMQAKGKERLLWIIGFPVWFPLLVAGFAVGLSLYVSLWAVIISLWAVFGSLVLSAAVCVPVGIALTANSGTLTVLTIVSAALICAGLSIFLFFGCRAATTGTVLLTKKLCLRCFTKKEGA